MIKKFTGSSLYDLFCEEYEPHNYQTLKNSFTPIFESRRDYHDHHDEQWVRINGMEYQLPQDQKEYDDALEKAQLDLVKYADYIEAKCNLYWEPAFNDFVHLEYLHIKLDASETEINLNFEAWGRRPKMKEIKLDITPVAAATAV